MKFIIKKNQDGDIRAIKSFYNSSWSKIIKDSWPEIKSQNDIEKVIGEEYLTELKLLNNKINSFKKNEPNLQKIAKIISVVMNEKWGNINTITIDICFCPIAPRFLKTNSFMLPVYYSNKILLNWSAHEMIHFLYFKKWQRLFPESKPKNFEYPDPVWALSEIAAPVIAEGSDIKKVLKTESNLYDHWQDIKIENMDLKTIFLDIFEKSDSFDDFINDSWRKYEQLDKVYSLTKSLTG